MLHDITLLFTQYLHILHRLQTMKMTFKKLFLICTFKDPKFGGKMYKFGVKSKRKLNSKEFMEFVFSKSGQTVDDRPFPVNSNTLLIHTLSHGQPHFGRLCNISRNFLKAFYSVDKISISDTMNSVCLDFVLLRGPSPHPCPKGRNPIAKTCPTFCLGKSLSVSKKSILYKLQPLRGFPALNQK